MELDEYQKLIYEIGDIEIALSSIGECKRTLAELEEREKILLKIKESINGDIRKTQGIYLKKRSIIRKKYSPNASQGFLESLKPGSLAKKRATEMRRMNAELDAKVAAFEEMIDIIDDVIDQIDDAKIAAKNCVKERLSL